MGGAGTVLGENGETVLEQQLKKEDTGPDESGGQVRERADTVVTNNPTGEALTRLAISMRNSPGDPVSSVPLSNLPQNSTLILRTILLNRLLN